MEICGNFQFMENFVNSEIRQNNNLHSESMETMVQWCLNHVLEVYPLYLSIPSEEKAVFCQIVTFPGLINKKQQSR